MAANIGEGSFALFCFVLFCFVLFSFLLFALQLSVCLWWHDYHRDDFPTLKFGVVLADLAHHLLREEPFALCVTPTKKGRRARALLTHYNKQDQLWLEVEPCVPMPTP